MRDTDACQAHLEGVLCESKFLMNKTGIIFVGLILAGSVSLRADSGSEVVVVYNSRVPESKSLAEYYAGRRHVPTNQLFGFALSTGENMSRAEFQDSLQKPLARALEKNKLWHIASEIIPPKNEKPGRVEWKVKESKIRYAVLCYGVPVRITDDPNLKEAAAETMRPEMRRNGAAVDTELALLPCIEQNLPLAGPLRNPLYAATNAAAFHPTNGVLMVTRLDGPSAEIARGLVDKAIAAETSGLWGRAYFDLRGITDPNYKPGDDMFHAAAETCRRWGFETVVDTNSWTFPKEFPMSQIAIYSGWYAVEPNGPFIRDHVEFMPGAFAYHLFSYSALNLRSATQSWVGVLLAKGATATMGAVDEPYLGGTPDIAAFLSRLMFNGLTFGEAAYAGQTALSWQTTIVGDPLYRPFGKSGRELHQELEQQHSNLIEWSYLRLVNLNLAQNAPVSVMAGFLEQVATTKQSAVLTEKLADLYVAEGKPSSAAELYEEALKLNPSPQQRVRLRLALEEKLMALNREQAACENMEKFLQENPDYPALIDIYRKLLPLAQKLGKKEDAARYEQEIQRLNPPPPAAK
jgi:uncharacterized protein (TIGR03790 family)